jgi:flagellar assembly protein FliH
MYKRPTARRPNDATRTDRHDHQGWQKWQMGVVQSPAQEHAAEQNKDTAERAKIDLEAIKHHQQELEIEQLRLAAQEQGQAQGYEVGFEQGKAIGFQAGHKEGMELEQARAQSQLKEQLAVLQTVVDQGHDELSRLQQALGQSLVHLGVRIAEHVLGHELRHPTESVLAIVRRILELNDDDQIILTVRLNPAVLNEIGSIVETLPTLAKIRLIGDESLGRADVVVKTPHGEIDARLQTRWAAAVGAIGYTDPLMGGA